MKIIRILPGEEYLLDGSALLILDILVELEEGSLANVEIQKIPYLFPGERMSCYSSDLVLRQYSRVKGEKGKAFKYSDIKPVYTIVIYEKAPEAFRKLPGIYLHHGRTTFDSGLELNLLQEYWLIALDVFQKIPYPKHRSEQTAWISLLATENVTDAEKLVAEYPWLAEIYREMEEYIHKPEEVLNMFSEALKIMDQNTVQYMIEQQQETIDEQLDRLVEQQVTIGEQLDRLVEQQVTIDEQSGRLVEQQVTIGEQLDRLVEQQVTIDEQSGRLVEQQVTIGEQQNQIGQQQNQINQMTEQINEQQNQIGQMTEEITRLKMLLEKNSK